MRAEVGRAVKKPASCEARERVVEWAGGVDATGVRTGVLERAVGVAALLASRGRSECAEAGEAERLGCGIVGCLLERSCMMRCDGATGAKSCEYEDETTRWRERQGETQHTHPEAQVRVQSLTTRGHTHRGGLGRRVVATTCVPIGPE